MDYSSKFINYLQATKNLSKKTFWHIQAILINSLLLSMTILTLTKERRKLN